MNRNIGLLLYDRLLRSSQRTLDPDTADYFFVPARLFFRVSLRRRIRGGGAKGGGGRGREREKADRKSVV